MIQGFLERLLYATRWLLAPIYLGLGLALFALTFKFCQELFHLYGSLLETSENGLILKLLSLIDMVLIGSYENTEARMNIAADRGRPTWMGKLDPDSLKMKLAAAIVAISSIHLLEVFMNAEHIPNDKIFWYAALHITFVVSSLMMAGISRLTKH